MKPSIDVATTHLGASVSPSIITNLLPVYWDSSSTWDSGLWEQLESGRGNPSGEVSVTKLNINVS
jgi:hypothetical protein